jgi:hypothetical protein
MRPRADEIAYSSDEVRPSEVYLQPFPADGRRDQVSKDGGSHSVWRADGKELFYLTRRGR